MGLKFKLGLKTGDKGAPVKDLKTHLKLIGFLASDIPDDNFILTRDSDLPVSDGDSFEEKTTEALKSFQRFYHLKETGFLNEETIHLLESPRCSNPDRPMLYDPQTGLVAYFVVQGNKWNRSNVTYAFQNFTGDLSSSDIINAVREAFRSWSNACFLTFTERTGYADILIKFVTGNHGDGSPFDAQGGILAHGFYPPPNGGDIAGDVHFDDAETWALNNPPVTLPPSAFDFWTVALHEIGHALGLNHSNDTNSVMYPYYPGIRRSLRQDDINGISSIYGGKGIKATLADTAFGQPAFASKDGTGFIAWNGTDNEHHLNIMQTKELRVWYDKCILPETSLSGPSITVFNGKLYLAWRGVGNNKLNIISSADGRTWAGKITLAETTPFSPAICTSNGKLFLAWTGTDGQRKLNIIESSDGVNWGNKKTIGDTSFDGPSVCNLGNRLLLSWTGTDSNHHLNVISYDGTSWFNKVTLGETSYKTPNIGNINGAIILSWSGTDSANKLNTLRSFNGVNFGNKATYNETSGYAPNLGCLNSRAILLWTGKDNAHSLNVMNI